MKCLQDNENTCCFSSLASVMFVSGEYVAYKAIKKNQKPWFVNQKGMQI